uniref:Ephrin RBD domain-containing protein n=1 Tax=Caenorhabditis japonica TaxID=281687 RepID=A0A8R1DWW3_CAEJA
MGDVVRFVCPDNDGRKPGEYLTVHEVSEFAMEDCALESGSREIIRCGPDGTIEKRVRNQGRDGEQQRRKIAPKNVAQLIRHLNPIPNGKEYQVGSTYYYITTSTGKAEGIDHRMFGLCESQNMRLSLKVAAAAHHVRPMAPTRRQEDFVAKNSAEMMGQEDEDSENDSAHLLPRDLDVAVNPKFRRPSQLEQAAASAGVQDQQFLKVVQMAKEGRTGTFENEKKLEEEAKKSAEKDGWHPVNVQYVADMMNNAYQNVDASLSYQREPDFEIHEDSDLSVKSLEYSSSTSMISTFFSILTALLFALI